MSSRKASRAHVVIENVGPAIEGDGAHPIKRVLGEAVHVGADIYKDGHELIGARLLYRAPGVGAWRSARMTYEFAPDRWFAELHLDVLGRWQYTIEAWPDAFATWRSDLRKLVEAGQDVASELLEGARMLERIVERATGRRRDSLVATARELGDPARDTEERATTALAADTAELVTGPVDESARTRYARVLEILVDRERAVFGAWYELFPRSQARESGRHATFADAALRLRKIADLGFDVVYLAPIHPIGHTHRKGRNNAPNSELGAPGSPWAIGSEDGGHTAVHPALGTLADFERFVGEAEREGMEVALDIALQCSPDHPWVREHPDWFFRRPDGTIHYAENPPKQYEDIYPLNFWCDDHQNLWRACRDVFLFWIENGVKIFRVDNPHTKPFAFWEWCLAELQRRHPDVILLAEAFTRPKRMKGLAKIGFNQSYTYFTWKNTRWELSQFMSELVNTDMREYFRPNFFTNTPDILHQYLQTGGRPAFRVRLVLAATLSPSYGIYSGFELCENLAVASGSEEYLHSEKYEIRVRDWDAPGNINDDVRVLNRLRREHGALQRLANVRFFDTGNEQLLCYHKGAPNDDILVVVNLDPHHTQEGTVPVPIDRLGIGANETYEVQDLLTGERFPWRGTHNYVRLEPHHRVAHLLALPSRGISVP